MYGQVWVITIITELEIEIPSPELLADPRTDHSVYALDPLQVPELMVGRGLLTWLMSESGRVVGTVKEDYVDGEDVEVLEVRLSLTPVSVI